MNFLKRYIKEFDQIAERKVNNVGLSIGKIGKKKETQQAASLEDSW